jgi:ABC-type transport system substrate-binding protein
VRQEPGIKLEFEAFEEYYRPGHIEQLVMIGIPETTTRIAMLERAEADIIDSVPGELIEKVKNIRFLNAIEPRIVAEKWQDIFPTITTGYAYPWEDIRLKD